MGGGSWGEGGPEAGHLTLGKGQGGAPDPEDVDDAEKDQVREGGAAPLENSLRAHRGGSGRAEGAGSGERLCEADVWQWSAPREGVRVSLAEKAQLDGIEGPRGVKGGGFKPGRTGCRPKARDVRSIMLFTTRWTPAGEHGTDNT